MSLSIPLHLVDSEQRVIVVLQDEQAFWFRWQGQVLLDSYVEPVSGAETGSGIYCPWISHKLESPVTTIELVLDTAMDELDRVRSESLASGLLGRFQRARLIRSVRRDYPRAEIHRLPDYMAPDVVSILHNVIPAMWEGWLRVLQDQNIQISHVATSSEVLARQSTRFTSPVLFITSVGRDRRHLLVDQAVPLFMRVFNSSPVEPDVLPEQDAVQAIDSPDSVSAIVQTLDYLEKMFKIDRGQLALLTPVLSWPSPSPEFSAARVLAALCAGCQVDYLTRRWNEGGLHTLTEQAPQVRSSRFTLWFQSLQRRVSNVLSSHKPVTAHGPHQRWHVFHRRHRLSDVFSASVKQGHLECRIGNLRKATLLCALMAAVTVTIASVHGISMARQRAFMSDEQQRLSLQVDSLSSKVFGLSASPAFVLRSIRRIEAYQMVKPISSHEVLTTVAQAITDFPALILDSLTWSVIDAGVDTDASFASTAQATSREFLWTEDTARTQVHIELSGVVINEQGLREQQQALDAFVSYLEGVPGISLVTILESPVFAARSSDVMQERVSSYRLSLVLSTS